MPGIENGSNKFRAVMQQQWMRRLNSSPRRLVAAATATRTAQAPPQQQRTAKVDVTSAHPYYAQLQQYASALQHRCIALWHEVTAGAAAGGEGGTASHIATPSPERAMNTIEQLRRKVQEALQAAAAEAARRQHGSASPSAQPEAADTAVAVEGTTRQLYHRMQDAVRETRQYYNSLPFDERWDGIRRGLDVLGRTTTGNEIVVYHDSAEAFAAMWAAVDRARREVLWQTYICKDDRVGRATVQRLLDAHRRGCHTELLYDCGGNIAGRGRLTEELRSSGARVICYRPFFRSFFRYLSRGLDWRISPGLRNHRKILLVDGAIGFCGGLNIGNEYCGPSLGGTGKFRDTHCSLVGPAVASLREVYDDTTRPQLWKYGWRRWRQIASTALSRRYEQGKEAMQPPRSTTTTTRHSTGEAARVSRAGPTTTVAAAGQPGDKAYKSNNRAVEDDAAIYAPSRRPRRRWEKQRRQFQRLMQWYTARQPAREVGSTSREDNAQATPDTAAANNTMRVGVMRQKIEAARMSALQKVSDIAYKRSYTKLLRHVPLADGEAVPEAELYSLRRPAVTQVLSCNPRYKDYSIQFAYWQVTRKCHRRIWVTTPYYLPTPRLLRALLQAASRGVDVRLLAGSRQTTDPWFMWHASRYITERLLRAGVRVYEYKGPAIMHAKTIVVDSIWSSIGSYNWDVLSNKNLEVCVCHTDFALARAMERQFLHDLSLSEEVLLKDHSARPWWLRFTAWLFYHGVYLANRIAFFTYVNEDVDEGGT